MNRKEGEVHRYLFHQGREHRAYDYFGARRISGEPADGILFRVYAPHAEEVFVVGDFNDWEVGKNPMKKLPDDVSILELSVAEARLGQLYKFAIRTKDGRLIYKADPYAFESECGEGKDASRISDAGYGYKWRDQSWMKARSNDDLLHSPVNIYEVHLGSWMHQEDGSPIGYRGLAKELIPYVKRMGYTHIEILPVMEYPYEASWGYQVTGYYSVTSRYGTPEDFKYFIDEAHRKNIGVIMDWVPAHFPKDAFGLAEFDGDLLYEDKDPLRREHKSWGTLAFDFGMPEVRSFLVSSAYFFLDLFHLDGIRVDAVAAMLYLDYDRADGEWRPNKNGGKENLEAVSFLQELNRAILTDFPGIISCAEESTAWPGVTLPPEDGGLGFNFKWNIGWMNDALSYFETDPLFRRGIHNRLTFSLTYAYSENYILPVSHDEVVHGKRSLLSKMPGEYNQKFDGYRSFLVYMMTHPGKKLFFMGAEIAQFIEWDEKKELDWVLLEYDMHRRAQAFVRELNRFYAAHPALWKLDDRMEGFGWIDPDNCDDNVFSYYRTNGAKNPEIEMVILNLSGKDYKNFAVGVPKKGTYEKVLDSDLRRFGGRGIRRKKMYGTLDGPVKGAEQFVMIDLPALSGVILEWKGQAPSGAKQE
ncbi:MAG: 1,4-alpha-glucan branching protein GlgB [Eubacteriales bacterium]|nr:1,4-alpha-glucan branching protein GlgB [Eubacteriales bacterium]